MKAKLVLENGMEFEGMAFGKIGDCVGEVVFNTGMTGYQEILTDPSYYGQTVVMTYPLIGNYGVNLEDLESKAPKVKGFIVREKCELSSNFRSEMELGHYLEAHGVMGMEGVDTRALTRVLRNHGVMKGIITTKELSEKTVVEKLKAYDNTQAVYQVTTKEKYVLKNDGKCKIDGLKINGDNEKDVNALEKHIAIMDFGVKQNILRNFQKLGCRLTVFPAGASSKDILAEKPDLVFLSNGPGDPADLESIVETVKALIAEKPVAGICLGHQLIAIALGGSTSKLKFGHHGCNHPVKDIQKNKVYITSQNHNYYVDKLPENTEMTHISINDGTVEGMRHLTKPVFSVQFHPEAAPGPVESSYLFEEFLALTEQEVELCH